jgi:crotonobetainyl-CoA:carnitine CoA-transferase CaiB-like acyl-CoA transferase
MVADMAGAGLHPLLGVLIALIAREKTGRGQLVDISYTDSVFGLIGFDIMFYLLTKEPRRRGKTLQTGSEPCAAIYQTKDGEYITIQFIESQFWKNFCQAIGKPELIDRQWAASDKDRAEMFNILKELFLTKTRDEWWQWSKDKQVMLAPVLYIEEAINDPQIRARNMMMELDYPHLGKVMQVGNPLKLSDTPPSFKKFSPLPGQNTDEILSGLGFSSNEIQEYRKEKVVE